MSSHPRSLRTVVKQFTDSGVGYAIANFGSRAVGFLMIPLLTRLLAPNAFGIVQLAEATASFGSALFMLALPAGLGRYYYQYDDRTRDRFLSTVARTAIALAAFGIPGALWSIYLWKPIPWGTDEGSLILHLLPALFGAFGLVLLKTHLTSLQMGGRSGLYAFWSLTQALLAAGLGVALVLAWGLGASGWLWGRGAGTLLVALPPILLLASRGGGRFDRKIVRRLVVFSAPLVAHQLVAITLTFADRFVIEHYLGLEAVGHYSAAYLVGNAMAILTTVMMLVWTPFFYREMQERPNWAIVSNTALLLSLFACAVASLGALWAEPGFVWLVDERYHSAAKIPAIIIGGYLLHALFSIWQLGVLQTERTQHLVLLTAPAAVANVVLNLLLVPDFGLLGAAFATMMAFALEAAAVVLYVRRALPWKLRGRHLLGALAIFGGCLAVGLAGPTWLRVMTTGFALAVFLRLASDILRTSPEDKGKLPSEL